MLSLGSVAAYLLGPTVLFQDNLLVGSGVGEGRVRAVIGASAAMDWAGGWGGEESS